MNFLAHLYLAGNDEALRLGALLGDFVRGTAALEDYDVPLQRGIRLHRHIDSFTDALPEVIELRKSFQPPFRRYAGIIIDLGLDHELAKRWNSRSTVTLETFDRGVRALLERHRKLVLPGLARFMAYADRRGLFAAYADEAEMLFSLRGIGTRLKRPNPLHRCDEIWDETGPRISDAFDGVFDAVQSEVDGWVKSRSTTTGS